VATVVVRVVVVVALVVVGFLRNLIEKEKTFLEFFSLTEAELHYIGNRSNVKLCIPCS
jgi:hypothetical protein